MDHLETTDPHGGHDPGGGHETPEAVRQQQVVERPVSDNGNKEYPGKDERGPGGHLLPGRLVAHREAAEGVEGDREQGSPPRHRPGVDGTHHVEEVLHGGESKGHAGPVDYAVVAFVAFV